MTKKLLNWSILLLFTPTAWAGAETLSPLRPTDAITFAAQSTPGAVQLYDHAPTPIIIDEGDSKTVAIAAGLLAEDLGRVGGTTANVLHNIKTAPNGGEAVIIGTLGASKQIDRIVADNKIDVSAISGKWETYLIQTVERPAPNIHRALVIIGSDRRGTAYGALTLSKRIGVSPWYWWADVPVPHRNAVYIGPGRFSDGSPTIKYRGIFLNDEAPAMSGWTQEKFGGFNSKMYVHVFELLLRLKANYLWPAMWGAAFNVDDPENPKLANDYGIVMGTSHQEPMLRAQGEFDHRFTADKWNYATHPDVLHDFWRDGVVRNKAYDSIITMGLRGRNDAEMIPGASEAQSIALLEKIFNDQRKILADDVNPDVSKIPQLWCLYKEVQSYYEHGLRVPDDVTLLWSDDNWGNLRRLPTAEERNRAGGSGIYYHFDYVGGPRNYKWINTNPLGKIWHQMTLAHSYGADRIWIVNVGDLKPMELPIDFFLTMAWNPDAMTAETERHFVQSWMAAQFGPARADEMAELYRWYVTQNGLRKPELLNTDPNGIYSENYDEAQHVLDTARTMRQKAAALAHQIPTAQRDAFFELIEYPVSATAVVNELYILAARNRRHAAQGDSVANALANDVRARFAEDAALTARYNHDLAGGKWNHMMDQTHIGYTNWQEPKQNILPKLFSVAADSNPKQQPASAEKIWPVTPSDAHGFIEKNGIVSMDAAHFTDRKDTPTARWQTIDGMGRSGLAVAIMAPPDVTRIALQEARLSYDFTTVSCGYTRVLFYASPTLPVVSGRTLRLEVQIDDRAWQRVDFAADTSNGTWQNAVKNTIRIAETTLNLDSPGKHRLTLRALDPNIVLQKIVIDEGGLQPSYLGPPETRIK